jgi:hypothetical protein
MKPYLLGMLVFMSVAAPAPGAAAQTPVNADDAVAVASSGFIFNRRTQTFDTTVTIRNTSATSLSEPSLILTHIVPADVVLINATGRAPNGAPALALQSPNGSLGPGQIVSVVAKFRPRFNTSFTFRWSMLALRDRPPAQARVIGVSPSYGPSGTFVQVTGTGFTPTSVVAFGNITARSVFLSPTSIGAYVPFAIGPGTIAALAPAQTPVAVDGGSAAAFTITALPLAPGPPGQVLIESLASISDDFVASEAGLRSALVASAASSTDPNEILYFKTLADLISPVHTLLTSLLQLPGILTPDALRLLDGIILANGGGTPTAATLSATSTAPTGDDCSVGGDLWIAQRLSLVKSQAVLSSLSSGVATVCKTLVGLVQPEAVPLCVLPQALFSVATLEKDLQLARYGRIVGLQIDATRAFATDHGVRIEAYPSRHATLAATIGTQRQSTALTWVKAFLDAAESLVGLATVDGSAFSSSTLAALENVEHGLTFIHTLTDAALNKGTVPQIAPICSRPVSFSALEIRPPSQPFGLPTPAGCSEFPSGLVSATGVVSPTAPLPHALTCSYGVSGEQIVEELENDVTSDLTLFTPALQLNTASLRYTAHQGLSDSTSQTFQVQASIIDGSVVLSADPNLEWTLTTVGGSLDSSLVVPTPAGGTLQQGDVTVAINTAGLTAGRYSAMLRVDAPDLNASPQTIALDVSVIARTMDGMWTGTYTEIEAGTTSSWGAEFDLHQDTNDVNGTWRIHDGGTSPANDTQVSLTGTFDGETFLFSFPFPPCGGDIKGIAQVIEMTMTGSLVFPAYCEGIIQGSFTAQRVTP